MFGRVEFIGEFYCSKKEILFYFIFFFIPGSVNNTLINLHYFYLKTIQKTIFYIKKIGKIRYILLKKKNPEIQILDLSRID